MWLFRKGLPWEKDVAGGKAEEMKTTRYKRREARTVNNRNLRCKLDGESDSPVLVVRRDR